MSRTMPKLAAGRRDPLFKGILGTILQFFRSHVKVKAQGQLLQCHLVHFNERHKRTQRISLFSFVVYHSAKLKENSECQLKHGDFKLRMAISSIRSVKIPLQHGLFLT